jgi:hypothetical protein
MCLVSRGQRDFCRFISRPRLRLSSDRGIIPPMPLTDHEKTEFAGHAQLLEDMGEPEALVGALRRICERKANIERTPYAEAIRWKAAANALMEAEAAVNARLAPEARKLADHMDEWSPDATQEPQTAQDTPNDANAPAQP